MAFRHYLEDEEDKPYYQLNTLAWYYEDMERKEKLIKDLTTNIVGYDEKLTTNLEEVANEVAVKLSEFDDKIETLPASVNDLLERWVDDGSIKTIIDTTLIDQKTAALTAQLAETEEDILAAQQELGSVAKLSAGKKGVLYAGVIRNSGTGWQYVSDDIHKNINFSSIDTTANNEIVVYFQKGKMIGSMVVTPDETLASFGLTCGASVGDTAAFIKSYAPFTGYIDGSGVIVGNEWFNGAHTVTPIGDGTGFTINYDGGGNGRDKVLVTNVRDSAPPHNGLDIRAARGGAGQVTLRSYHDLYGYVYFDGSSWQIASSCVANLSATFDNVTGVLTITHDAMSGGVGYNEFQSAIITERKQTSGSLIHSRIHSVTQSQIKVEFYDHTGNLILTPDTNMRVFMSRPGYRVPHTWNAGAKAYFDFGQALVRPSKLISGNGNLWILGLHESF